MNTFNVKIVIMLCLIIILLISVSTVYFLELSKIKGADYLFIPIIIGLILTLIRFYNNISEKSKIVAQMRQLKEDGNDEEKIQFLTCPEYWTKTTHKDNVYCHNKFSDIENKHVVIGSELTNELNSGIVADVDASTIGFKFDMKTEGDNKSLQNPEKTYIPTMRSNATYPKNTNDIVVENFAESPQPTEDNTLHKHTWTYYAHKDDITWDGDANLGNQHANHKYDDDDHLINVSYWHNHGEDSGLFDKDGKPIKTEKSDRQSPYIPQSYSNDTNWISPYVDSDGKMYAEINLNELNKTKNKCDLVKNLAWVEANNKCGTINKKFDL